MNLSTGASFKTRRRGRRWRRGRCLEVWMEEKMEDNITEEYMGEKVIMS